MLARDAKGKARAGTPREAAQEADAVLLAVHWSRVDDVLQQAGDLSGKVIVSCSLPMNADDTDLVIAHTSSGAEELARKVPKVRVVSAFGTVPSEVLFDVFEARRKARKPSLVYCGDDASGKKVAAQLIRDVGWSRSMPGRYGSRGTRSRSRSSSRDSPTRETRGRSSRTGLSGFSSEPRAGPGWSVPRQSRRAPSRAGRGIGIRSTWSCTRAVHPPWRRAD